MLRRSPRSTTALDQTKQELARQESELRDQMEKLERMIADAPRVAEEVEKRQREELLMRASQGGSRLDVSMALHDKRYGDTGSGKRRGSLRGPIARTCHKALTAVVGCGRVRAGCHQLCTSTLYW